MSKYRVYELAKEFNTQSKLILDILARNNMPAKNHMASIEEEAYQVLVRTFAPKPDTAEEIRERQRKKAASVVQPPKPEPTKAPAAPPKVFYGGAQRSGLKPRMDQPGTTSTHRPAESHPKAAVPTAPQSSSAAASSVRSSLERVAAMLDIGSSSHALVHMKKAGRGSCRPRRRRQSWCLVTTSGGLVGAPILG